MSRIPSENREPFKDPLMDTNIFKITVLGANTLVVGQLICKMSLRGLGALIVGMIFKYIRLKPSTLLISN